MTLPKESGLLGLDNVSIFEITTDNSQELVYGATINIPSMQNINLEPSYIQKPLMEDEEIDGYYSKLQSISWSFTNVKIGFDVLTILEGGTLTSSGFSPNEQHTFTLYDSSEPKYFKLEGKINYSTDNIGDFHLLLYKCKALSVSIEYKAQNYAIVSASGIAIPTKYDKKVRDYIFNETAVAIN